MARRPSTDDSGHDVWRSQFPGPEVDGRLRFTVGGDFLEEFVAGHTPSDMLRELVQNEYDAGGSRLEAVFDDEGLRVRGNGNPIDSAGWRRLSVMFSTGHVAGGVAGLGDVQPKLNGIGSKNAGLRTLFLVGDRIHVRSSGEFTLLDLRRGALPSPEPDPTSRRSRGVEISVPYRHSNSRLLEAFTAESELEALESFSNDLSQVLLKLAQPGAGRNLTHLAVSSKRHNRRVSWTQTVEKVTTRVRDVTALRRQVRRYDERESGRAMRSQIEEMDFQRSVVVPPEHVGQSTPGYFRTTKGRVRLSVSMRLRGQKPDPKTGGLFYYPIGVRDSCTGNALSVCAPFLMNTERTLILDHPWNAWLQHAASQLAVELLTADWITRFGPDALRVFLSEDGTASSQFKNATDAALRSHACWPTRASKGRSRHFARAADLVVPANVHLDGYVTSAEQVLGDVFAGCEDLVDAAKHFGAKTFTLNSLVRLRCAPEAGVVLRTKLSETEAEFWYPEFPNVYDGERGLALQKQMGRTLDHEHHHLSSPNRADLRDLPATLAADCSLAAPKDLWLVPPAMANTTQVPASGRLHPELGESRTLSRLCKRFSAANWLLELCEAARAGQAGEDDLQAGFAYIRAVHGRLPSKVRGAVRRSPVVLDHRGAWVEPASLTSPAAPGASLLEPVLHFPSSEVTRDPQLMSQLAVRRKIADDDLVTFAGLHVTAVDVAERFEAILWERRKHLTARTVGRLAHAKFLRSTTGEIESPGALYISNRATIASVGGQAGFVAGSHIQLYRRLGCADQPRAADIVANLATMSNRGEAPAEPDILYPALVNALRAERAKLTQLSEEPVVWTNGRYSAPADVLVGSRFPSVLGVLPQVRGSEVLHSALKDLGAAAQPTDRHWRTFFELLGAKYRSGSRVSEADARRLRDAYTRRGRQGLPADLRTNVACILGRDGAVYSQDDVAAGRLVLNDHPDLAGAATNQRAPIAFPDREERVQEFFGALGLKSLTEISGTPKALVGSERSAPAFLREADLLAQIHSDDFASALAALARHELRGALQHDAHSTPRLRRRLRELTRLVVVESVTLSYPVGRSRVSVPAEVWLAETTIYVTQARSVDGVRGLVAMAVAEVMRSPLAYRQRIADSIYRLLSARRTGDMADYLRRRGIDWVSCSAPEPADEGQEGEDLGEALGDLARSLLDQARSRASSSPVQSTPDRPAPTPPAAPKPIPLPPLDQVKLHEAPADPDWTRPDRSGSGGGGGGGQWHPRSASEVARDQATGRRAEELVFRNERQRVRRLGLDENLVVWTSDLNPGADHDIKSVDDDGGDLWLEVKGTVGTDGRFVWSVGEFTKALRERSRYVLWRVYEADTEHPTARQFRDPIAMLGSAQVRVGISSLTMEVEPLEPR